MGIDRGHIVTALAGLIVGVMVIAMLPAGAANGDAMVLGARNTAKNSTKIISNNSTQLLNRKPGRPALSLFVEPGAPPIAVNSPVLITDLNADLLDGMHASDLQGATGAQGPPGADGKDGVDGEDGEQGPPGADGEDGADGQPCSVEDNLNGTASLTCPDGSEVLIPAVRTFAVAYTNLDGLDGYSSSADQLIAKLVDTNGDGVVSVGDTVVMGRYPTNLDGSTFGDFGVTSHMVVTTGAISGMTISVRSSTDEFWFSHFTQISLEGEITTETYSEVFRTHEGEVWTRFHDTVGSDDLAQTNTGSLPGVSSPSEPDTALDLLRGINSTDHIFIDVDIFI